MTRFTAAAVGFVTLGLALPSIGVAGKAGKPPKPGKAPSTVRLSARPNPVVFGRTVAVSGAVVGPAVSGQTVTLQADPYPLDGVFKPVATGTTTSTGTFTFFQRPGVNTQYRVVAKTKPPATSPTVLVRVRVAISLRVSDTTPTRGQVVRFSGRARPAHNGRLVAIQKRTRSGFRTVARTRLVANDASSSRYSRKLRIRSTGTYRVLLGAHADHTTGISQRRTLRVH